jgi:hypothetical protein
MAKRGEDGKLKGQITGRSQVKNPQTGLYTKRDTTTGKFVDGKSDGKPFKSVRKEK